MLLCRHLQNMTARHRQRIWKTDFVKIVTHRNRTQRFSRVNFQGLCGLPFSGCDHQTTKRFGGEMDFALGLKRPSLAASAARAWQVPNQNLQTSGVTNVVSSQAMTAIPLPMER